MREYREEAAPTKRLQSWETGKTPGCAPLLKICLAHNPKVAGSNPAPVTKCAVACSPTHRKFTPAHGFA